MRDVETLRDEFARQGCVEPHEYYKLFACSICLRNHNDPKFEDCLWSSCNHCPNFGCRCIMCNPHYATTCYTESSQEHDSAFEETDSAPSMEENDFRDDRQYTTQCRHCKIIKERMEAPKIEYRAILDFSISIMMNLTTIV